MDTKEKVRRTPPPNGTVQTKTRRRAAAESRKRSGEKQGHNTISLPAKPFNRGKLLLRLATVAAIVVAIVVAMSVFFKVENIEVSGTVKYSAWDICEASGIRKGDDLMSFGFAGAAAKIKELLYVKDVRIGIRLPNTVVITVTEVEVTYAVKAQDDSWWLISSAGRVIEKAKEGEQELHTKILGVRLLNPSIGQSAVAQETQQTVTDENGVTIPPVNTAAKRLATVLKLTDYLELNGIIGDAASIDVNDLNDIQLWYGEQYQVKFGNSDRLDYKVSCMKSAIEQLEDYQSGVLDVTFSNNQDAVKYTPFQ